MAWRVSPHASSSAPRGRPTPQRPARPRAHLAACRVLPRSAAESDERLPCPAPSRRSCDGTARVGGDSAAMELRDARERIVREHMESENRHEFDVTLATFDHPRYEIVPTGDVYDGPDEVSQYFADTRAAFPDQRNRLIALHHADDAVIAEFMLLGTHRGELRGMAPTGRSFECRCVALFVFEEDRLVCERVYFDTATILRQLLDQQA